MFPTSVKPSAALATLRHLATLGYPARTLMPSILEALQDIVPFDNANFIWMDEDCNATDMHNFNIAPEPVVRLCQEQYFNRRDALFVPSHRIHMRELLVDRSAVVEGFQNTEFFDEIFRPSGYRSYLRLSVRDGVAPVGVFHFYRQFSSPDFTRKEEQQIIRALPWIAHALAAPPSAAPPDEMIEGESGLVIAAPDGEIRYLSQGARVLLHHAAGKPINLDTLADLRLNWARPLIRSVVLTLLAAGENRGEAVPVRYFNNQSGVFRLRAYWLDAAAQDNDGGIAIQIQRQLPLTLKLLQTAKVRALPHREQQACLMLAQGHTSTEIARRMTISPNGAVYHIRSLYNRIGISRRDELVKTLLA